MGPPSQATGRAREATRALRFTAAAALAKVVTVQCSPLSPDTQKSPETPTCDMWARGRTGAGAGAADAPAPVTPPLGGKAGHRPQAPQSSTGLAYSLPEPES